MMLRRRFQRAARLSSELRPSFVASFTSFLKSETIPSAHLSLSSTATGMSLVTNHILYVSFRNAAEPRAGKVLEYVISSLT